MIETTWALSKEYRRQENIIEKPTGKLGRSEWYTLASTLIIYFKDYLNWID